MTKNVISLVSKREEKLEKEKEEEFTPAKYLEIFLQEVKEKKINLKQFQMIFSEEVNGGSVVRYFDFGINTIVEKLGFVECAKKLIFHQNEPVDTNDN